jgi:hypothetical protein
MSFANISPIVSMVALAVSLFTLWFTVLRRGTIRSTHPSFVAFRYDFVGKNVPQAKIVFRALLFSTGKRGQVIESLFLRVREGSRQAEFSFWGLGDKDLVRGSGLFVPETGVATYHHFNPVDADALFLFSAGTYSLQLVAKLVGRQRLVTLWSVALEMPAGAFEATIARETAVYYNWSPEKRHYISSIENRPNAVQALFDSPG